MNIFYHYDNLNRNSGLLFYQMSAHVQRANDREQILEGVSVFPNPTQQFVPPMTPVIPN